MWNEIEVVPTRPADRGSTSGTLRDLAVLVVAAALAVVLSLIG